MKKINIGWHNDRREAEVLETVQLTVGNTVYELPALINDPEPDYFGGLGEFELRWQYQESTGLVVLYFNDDFEQIAEFNTKTGEWFFYTEGTKTQHIISDIWEQKEEVQEENGQEEKEVKKFDSFANVDMFVDGEEYVLKCAKCGEELHRTDIEYLNQNPIVSTEDFPAQLWKEHRESCPVVQERRQKMVSTARANGHDVSGEDFADIY